MKNRISTAIELLQEGKFFRIDDLRLGVSELGDIEVAGWSQSLNIENLTKTSSLGELNEIVFIFSEMMKNSQELKLFMEGKDILYSLYYDDYGKASILICTQKNGVLKWELKLE